MNRTNTAASRGDQQSIVNASAPKERPILFSSPMVRAILEGRKTQTRRIIKPAPDDWIDQLHGYDLRGRAPYDIEHPETGAVVGYGFQSEDAFYKCPYGKPGDRLYVRETWADVNSYDGPAIAYRADGAIRSWREFSETYGPDHGAGPSMDYDAYPGEYVMWSNDLLAGEPEHNWRPSIHMPKWASRITLEIVDVRVKRLQDISRGDCMAEGCPFPNIAKETDPIGWFSDLWESINGPESWGANPWVWVVEFKSV